MKYRKLGRTGWKVSEVSFGAWAIGGTWGPVDDKESLAALHKAIEIGVNFIDTADVYGDDHRKFNRHGEAFDRGETFSGVDYELGLKAAGQLKTICPKDMTMAQFALKWILMFDAVTCTIPGAKRPSQAQENISASDLPVIPDEIMKKVKDIYDTNIRELVYYYW